MTEIGAIVETTETDGITRVDTTDRTVVTDNAAGTDGAKLTAAPDVTVVTEGTVKVVATDVTSTIGEIVAIEETFATNVIRGHEIPVVAKIAARVVINALAKIGAETTGTAVVITAETEADEMITAARVKTRPMRVMRVTRTMPAEARASVLLTTMIQTMRITICSAL